MAMLGLERERAIGPMDIIHRADARRTVLLHVHAVPPGSGRRDWLRSRPDALIPTTASQRPPEPEGFGGRLISEAAFFHHRERANFVQPVADPTEL